VCAKYSSIYKFHAWNFFSITWTFFPFKEFSCHKTPLKLGGNWVVGGGGHDIFFTKDGGLRFIFPFVTITVFKTKKRKCIDQNKDKSPGCSKKIAGVKML